MRIRKMIKCSFVLLLFWFGMSYTVLAAPKISDMSAFSFYQKYGSGEIVFQEGCFYYASRGSAGDTGGTRYGVSGQKFTVQVNKAEYETGVALHSDAHEGSCKRIRYEKRDGYYYSLYEISYDRIYERLSKKYPNVDFGRLMYNRDVQLQIDFYLTLVKNQEDLGWIQERKDGTIQKNGKIYESYEGILHAANWSKRTKEALKGYFKLAMTIRQPSSYTICYHKGMDSSERDTLQQELSYAEEAALLKNSFSNVYSVVIYPDGGEHGMRTYTAKETFLGWAVTKGGAVIYKDRQKVKKLTDVHQGVVHLYAVWKEAAFVFPDAAKQEKKRLLGYSAEGDSVLIPKKQAERMELHQPGDTILVNQNLQFYGIWCRTYQKVQFFEPDSSAQATGTKVISGKKMEQIRKFMLSSLYGGKKRLIKLRKEYDL